MNIEDMVTFNVNGKKCVAFVRKLDEFAALLKSGAAGALIACRDELRNALAKAAGESEVVK